jgi:hypothetical protein
MTASKTATVETLTAEVRVLMVGSRQVTMSVYGQLDFIDPATRAAACELLDELERQAP